MSDRWRDTYDAWKTRLPGDDEREEGCICRRMTTRTKRDPWCPIHGMDPDDAREGRR